MRLARDMWLAYRLRWKRRRLIFRAIRSRHRLNPVADNTGKIRPADILGLMTVRNERLRLPGFLNYHRALGVRHFLVVDNGSDDGTIAFLTGQPDVSLWQTDAGYRAARFGMDWIGWLLFRYGHGHWCLTLDADELLVYPHCDTRSLNDLAVWLDGIGVPALPTMMLDLYPHGRLSQCDVPTGADALDGLCWFDPKGYSVMRNDRTRSCWIQGGPRSRMFFAEDPRRAPTMNKIPFVKWNRRYAYLNATHTLLPAHLNEIGTEEGGQVPSGVLLHTKFLPDIISRSIEEKSRRQHFGKPESFDAYYDALASDPVLWSSVSVRYRGWRHLADLGLMSPGRWL